MRNLSVSVGFQKQKIEDGQTMQTIKYRFADGTTSEIEVTDEFYTLYAELVQQEKRNHWKETRRHISLEYLNENGIDFASPAADLLSVLIQQEDEKQIHRAMAMLSDKQKDLAEKVLPVHPVTRNTFSLFAGVLWTIRLK